MCGIFVVLLLYFEGRVTERPVTGSGGRDVVRRKLKRKNDFLMCLFLQQHRSKQRFNALKACPHWRLSRRFRRQSATICRRNRRLSQKTATLAVFSPFSATVALFCDGVDRAIAYTYLMKHLRCTLQYRSLQYMLIGYYVTSEYG